MNEPGSVTVSVDLRTQFHGLNSDSEMVGVSGSCVEMGCWCPDRPAVATPSARSHWDLKLRLPASITVSWRWVVVDRTTGFVKRWEERDNRILRLNGAGVFIYSIWDGPDRVHMPIRPMRSVRPLQASSQQQTKCRGPGTNTYELYAPDGITSFPYTKTARTVESPPLIKSLSDEDIAYPTSPKKVRFPDKIVTSVSKYPDSDEEESIIGGNDTSVDPFKLESILKKSKKESIAEPYGIPNGEHELAKKDASFAMNKEVTQERQHSQPVTEGENCGSPVDLEMGKPRVYLNDVPTFISTIDSEHGHTKCHYRPDISPFELVQFIRSVSEHDSYGSDVDSGKMIKEQVTPRKPRLDNRLKVSPFVTMAQSVAIGAVVFVILKTHF